MELNFEKSRKQSYRDSKGKPKHKVIFTIGREDKLRDNPEMIEKIIKNLYKLSKNLIVLEKDENFLGASMLLGPMGIKFIEMFYLIFF